MKKMVAACALFVALLAVPAAFAQDGNKLLEACTAAESVLDDRTTSLTSSVNGTWCAGYVAGIRDANNMAQGYNVGGVFKACIPLDVKSGQLIRLLLKSMREHPEELHQSAAVVAQSTLNAAFPCAKGGKR